MNDRNYVKEDITKNHKVNKSGGLVRGIVAAVVSGMMVCTLTGCASRSEKAWELAEEDFASGDYEDAVMQLDKVIDNADPESETDMSLMLEAYYLKGDCYKKLGNSGGALKMYQEAIAADNANPDVERTATDYLRLGLAYIETEDYSGAIEAFENGLDMYEISCEKELMHNLIVCYEKTGNWDEAKSLAATYVEKYPEDTDILKEYQFLQTR